MQTTLSAKAIGARIRTLRRRLGMSQAELGGPTYSHAYISHLERGARRPTREVLEHIAQRLDVDLEQLETGRDPDLDLKLQLEIDKAIARLHSGELVDAQTQLESAQRKARKARLIRAEAAAEEGLGVVAKRRGDWLQARERFVVAEDLLADEPPEARTSLVTGRAWTYFMVGEISHAVHILETHLVELRAQGPEDPKALLQTYSYLIGPYFEAGLKEKAALAAEQAHRLESRVNDPEHVACMNINRAQILLEDDQREEALKCLIRAEDLFKQIGWRDSAVKAAVARATAAVEADDLGAAERFARTTLDELEDSPSVLDRLRLLNLLARVERRRGHFDAALEYLDQGNALADEHSLEEAWRLREIGLCHLAQNDASEAESYLRSALEIYRRAAAPSQIATTAAYLSDALRALGRLEDAADASRSGLAEIEDLAL